MVNSWMPILTGLLLLVAGCAGRPAIQSAIVEGPSMAPLFPGRHRSGSCPDCGWQIECDGGKAPDSGLVHCPMCGGESLEWKALAELPGAACQILPVPARLERWSVVAIRLPEEHGHELSDDGQRGRLGVKRIWGLPGETVSFDHGDLLIDGRRIAKPPSVQRDLWTPVHDSRFSTSSSLGRNWKVRETLADERHAAGRWQTGTGRNLVARWTAGSAGSREWQWLDYVHWPSWPTWPGNARPVWIDNHNPFNQGLSAPLTAVFDLGVELSLSGWKEAELAVEILRWDGNVVRVTIDCESGEVVAGCGEGPVVAARAEILPDRPTRVGIASYDGKVEVSILGRLVLVHEWAPSRSGSSERPPVDLAGAARPQVSIGARGGKLDIEQVWIGRDMHLEWGAEALGVADEGRPIALSAGAYFLLGDNLPASRDSRHWNPPGLPAAHVLGIVKSPE